MKLKLFTLAQTTVTTSGTPAQASSTPIYCTQIIVAAPAANTGTIYVGDSSVSTTRGIPVVKGTTLIISPSEISESGELDLSDLYLDAATSGDKANISYIRTST